MDPQAAWDQLLAAYAEGDWDTIEECATDLLAWLDRGGFPPKVVNRPDLSAEWHEAMARAGCSVALDALHSRWNPIPCESEEP
jgi:hypothetical protein